MDGGVPRGSLRISAVSTADSDNTAWMHLNGHFGAAVECWRIELAIESAKYKVAAHEGSLELRDYPPIVIAVAAVDGTRSHAVNAGFRLLADYIFGKNQWTSRIALTAPVTQSPRSPGEPFMTNIEHSSSWTISFMMPAGYAMQSLPAPTDVRVHFERAPARRLAAIRFSGFWSNANLECHEIQLLRWLHMEHVTALSAPIYAYYDPPWIPWFLRRIEVLIEIASN